MPTRSDVATVVLVDDHEFLLEGLKQRFSLVDDLNVIETSATVAGAIDMVQRRLPDFAVVDFRLPDGDGIELVREIRKVSPFTICVIYTSVSFDPSRVHGADAVVIKELFDDRLIDTMRELRDVHHLG